MTEPSALDEILVQYNRALDLVNNAKIQPIHRAGIAMYAAGISYVLSKVGVDHPAVPEIPEMDLTIRGGIIGSRSAKAEGDKSVLLPGMPLTEKDNMWFNRINRCQNGK